MMNPYVNLLDAAYRAQKESRRNEVMLHFVRMLEIKRGMHDQNVPVTPLASIGHRVNANDRDAIMVYDKGKASYWTFEPQVQQALQDMGEFTPPWWFRWITSPASLARASIVYFPGFMVRNVIRDPQHRAVVSRTASLASPVTAPVANVRIMLEGIASFFWGAGQAVIGGKNFNEVLDQALTFASGEEIAKYRAAGGGQAGNYYHNDRNYYRRLRREMRKMSADPLSHVIATPGMLKRGYQRLAQASELVTRKAEYQSAMARATALGYKGRSAVIFASHEARQLMDYQTAGTITRWLNRIVIFLNPQVQGLFVTGKRGVQHPMAFAIRFSMIVLGIALVRIVSQQLGDDPDEEEYLSLPAYKRDLFFCIKIGTNRWLFIPKAYEVGVLASAVDRLITASRGHKNAWADYPNSLANAMLPFDQGNLAGPFQAFVESLANYDFFRNRNIIPWYELDMPVWSRDGAIKSPAVSRMIAKAIGTDPRIVSHVAGSLLGDFGRLATMPPDWRYAMYKVAGVLGQSPAFEAESIEQARRSVKALGQTGSREAQYLGELLDDWRDAKTDEEREAAAKDAREFAQQLVDMLQPYIDEMNRTGERPTISRPRRSGR